MNRVSHRDFLILKSLFWIFLTLRKVFNMPVKGPLFCGTSYVWVGFWWESGFWDILMVRHFVEIRYSWISHFGEVRWWGRFLGKWWLLGFGECWLKCRGLFLFQTLGWFVNSKLPSSKYTSLTFSNAETLTSVLGFWYTGVDTLIWLDKRFG